MELGHPARVGIRCQLCGHSINSYAVAGSTRTASAGESDVWLFKLSAAGSVA